MLIERTSQLELFKRFVRNAQRVFDDRHREQERPVTLRPHLTQRLYTLPLMTASALGEPHRVAQPYRTHAGINPTCGYLNRPTRSCCSEDWGRGPGENRARVGGSEASGRRASAPPYLCRSAVVKSRVPV